MMALRYLWVQWSTRPDPWDYAAYQLTMAPPVLIALAARSIRFDPTIRSRALVRPKPETCLLVARVRVPSLDDPGVLHRGRLVAGAPVVHPRRASSDFARVHKARHKEPALGAMDGVEHLLGNHVGVLHTRAPGSASRSLVRSAQQSVAADHQQLPSIDLGRRLAAYS